MARVRGPTASSSRVDVDIVGRNIDIEEHRHQPVLQIGLTVVGKPAAQVMTSSPGLSAGRLQLGEVSAVSARQVGGRARIDGQRMLTPMRCGELLLELRR